MAQHRAHRAPTRAHSAQPAVPSVGGKRKAVKTKASRSTKTPSSTGTLGGSLLRSLPSAPIIAGVATLAVSAGGAAATNAFGDQITPTSAMAAGSGASIGAASAGDPSPSIEAGGTDAGLLEEREAAVSRDSRRTAAAALAAQEQARSAQEQAAEREQALKSLGGQAEKQAEKIEANLWAMPIHSYRITATFGMSSGLWARSHTGLDFAAPSGTPLMAIANGVITETGYDGAYGNKTVLTLEDGTEIWYCHQTSIGVSVGQTVRGGEVIGSVGSTGNTTGPHLHLEVRPSPDTPIDPWGVLLEHGLHP